MKSTIGNILSKGALPLGIAVAAALGWWMASSSSLPAVALTKHEHVRAADRVPSASSLPDMLPAKESPTEPDASAEPVPLPVTSMSLDELRVAWNKARTLSTLQPIAQELAERNSMESVQLLMEAIGTLNDLHARAELSKNLRAVSDPATLSALLPALLRNFGTGNTVLKEIADAIDRMAQPDTVEALAAMHWQASTQAGQTYKVLRTVAGIRNPPAKRALARLAEHAESPALAAAATEALKNFDPINP